MDEVMYNAIKSLTTVVAFFLTIGGLSYLIIDLTEGDGTGMEPFIPVAYTVVVITLWLNVAALSLGKM